MKILCNDSKMGNDYNITVMKDPLPNGNNGIHNLQYEQSITQPERSAANLFVANPQAGPYRNYYLEPGTNIISQFLYKYYLGTANENPVFRTPFTVLTTNTNTCPVHNTRPPQPPTPYLMPPSDSIKTITLNGFGGTGLTLDQMKDNYGHPAGRRGTNQPTGYDICHGTMVATEQQRLDKYARRVENTRI